MSRILKIDEFNNYEVSSQNDFMALSELDPSEGEGATYALSEKSKRIIRQRMHWRVPIAMLRYMLKMQKRKRCLKSSASRMATEDSVVETHPMILENVKSQAMEGLLT